MDQDQEKKDPASFSRLLSERYQLLTKSEKRIAGFLNANLDEAGFLSAGGIPEGLQLSEATMVRFARSLGFDSYPAMRIALQESFRSRMTHSSRLHSRLDELMEAGDIFEKLVASEIAYLTESLRTLNRQAFNQAVELLRSHERIFVFGLGPSVSLVDLLEVRLTRFGRQVIPLRSSGSEILDPLLFMNKKDLVIAIGFFNMTSSLKMVIEHANAQKAPVILVTDTLGLMVGDRATVTLEARRGPISSFNSLTVPMTIINTLLLALSSQDQDNVMNYLDKLDHLRDQFRNRIDHDFHNTNEF